MSKCKICKRGGLFFKTNKEGLCPQCTKLLLHSLKREKQIFDESMKLINTSKKIDTKMSRIDLIEEQANRLSVYEKKGINTVSPKPSKILRELPSFRDQIIVKHYKKDLKELKKQVSTLKTIKSKINKYDKYYNEMLNYQDIMKKPQLLNKLISKCLLLKEAEIKNNEE